jgi:hypothetical protein
VLTAATPQACAAAWDSHDQLLVAQVRNTVAHLDAKRKKVHKPQVLRDGDEVSVLQMLHVEHVWCMCSGQASATGVSSAAHKPQALRDGDVVSRIHWCVDRSQNGTHMDP